MKKPQLSIEYLLRKIGLIGWAGCGTILVAGCLRTAEEPRNHSPEAELATFVFADPSLQASLVASEPHIVSPVDIAWGPDGSLYVAEMPGYPVTTGRGAVKRLTDPDGDGYYDQMTVFEATFDFPSSVMYFDGGLLVADSPSIYYLKDNDGDGVADVKEIYLTGFTKSNEQYLLNALQWGVDNWVYGANGRSGGWVRFADSAQEISIKNRDFRFDPLKRRFEPISGLSQFGLARDNWGNRFVTLNHRFARQVVIEEHHLIRNPTLVTEAVHDTYQSEHDRRVYTRLEGLKRFNRDPIGYFTSLSGLTANRGHLLGADYSNSLFAGESVQAAVIHRRMENEGVTLAAINVFDKQEFLASDDDWFHPVNFSNGPDGAIYMVDFYRQFVEHPEWAHDDKSAGVDWNYGENNGRIWRISRKDRALEPRRMTPDFHSSEPLELVPALSDSAGWRRDMAQQLLVEGQHREVGPDVALLLGHDYPLARLHALWTLDGLGLLTPEQITQALGDEDPRIQIQGLRLAESRWVEGGHEELVPPVVALSHHQNADLRFQAILTLGTIDDLSIRNALLNTSERFHDKWTRIALLSSTSRWGSEFARRLAATYGGEMAIDDVSFFRQIGQMVANQPSDAGNEHVWIKRLAEKSALSWLEIAILAGYAGDLRAKGEQLPSIGASTCSYLLRAAQDGPEEVAVLALELLGHSASSTVHDGMLDFLNDVYPTRVRVAAINALVDLNQVKISEAIFDRLSGLGPDVRKELIVNSLASPASANGLLSAVDQEQISLTEIPEEVRQGLLNHGDSIIQQRAAGLLGAAVDRDRQALIDRYLGSMDKHTTDLVKGAQIFRENCATCHSIRGVGGLLGPDLTNIGSRTDDMLLTSILDPSRMVSYELKLRIIETKGGEVHSGTVSAETTSSLTVRRPTGEETTLLKENILKDQWTELSIMPEGYERIIDEESMANLLGFLRQSDGMASND